MKDDHFWPLDIPASFTIKVFIHIAVPFIIPIIGLSLMGYNWLAVIGGSMIFWHLNNELLSYLMDKGIIHAENSKLTDAFIKSIKEDPIHWVIVNRKLFYVNPINEVVEPLDPFVFDVRNTLLLMDRISNNKGIRIKKGP